jgi:hypothetical protein
MYYIQLCQIGSFVKLIVCGETEQIYYNLEYAVFIAYYWHTALNFVLPRCLCHLFHHDKFTGKFLLSVLFCLTLWKILVVPL